MATLEGVVLGGLDLNDLTNYRLERFETPIPKKKPQWVSGADSDGAELAEEAHYELRTFSGRVRVAPQASMDLALAKLGALTDKLQEASRGDVALVWTPANSTKSVTANVLMGEVDALPITPDGADAGWLTTQPSPPVDFTLTCRPFLRGALVSSAATVTSSLPLITVEVVSVLGDVETEATLTVTDAASQSRRYVIWGRESRYYNAATSLLIDSTSLVTSGFAGATGTRSGAYSGAANNVIASTLRTQAQAVCGTGTLAHVGTFRVFARVYCSATTEAVRLTWQAGEGPWRSNSYTQPVVAGWNHIDLGLVTVTPAEAGTQKWSGRIDAYSTGTGGEALDVDYLAMVPVEVAGVASAPAIYAPGVLTGFDDFTGTTAGAALNARTAPVGGSWATSGSTTDFVFADSGSEETAKRSTLADASPRFAILGSTNYTDTEVGADVTSTWTPTIYVVARWANSSNYVALALDYSAQRLRLQKVVAGSTTTLAEIPWTRSAESHSLRLVVFASGRAIGTLQSAATAAPLDVFDTALATGGALASGKPGFADWNTVSAPAVRQYDNFYAATPAPEPVVIYSGRSILIGSTSTKRYDSSGSYLGDPPSYVGSRFKLTPDGGVGRKNRIAAMVKRADVTAAADDNIADSTTLTVSYTPLYLTAPR